MRKLDAVLLAALVAGCAGTPVDQGGKAEIVFAGSDMIRMRWNPQLTNEREMRSRAMAYCGGRKVDPVESSVETAPSGTVQARTWRCDPFPGTGSGM